MILTFVIFVMLLILAESYSVVATRALTGVVMTRDCRIVAQDIVLE